MSPAKKELYAVSLPECGSCGTYWRPEPFVSAQMSYCTKCSRTRARLAESVFSLKPLFLSEFSGEYLLPRAIRNVQKIL